MAMDISGYVTNSFDWFSPSGAIGTVAVYIFWGLLLGGGLYLVWNILSYNVDVRAFRKGRYGFYQQSLKGKFYKNKENGQEYFKLNSKNTQWNQPLPRDYMIIALRGKRLKQTIYFAEDEEGRWQPMKPVMNDDVAKWAGWKNSDMEFAIGHARRMIQLVKKGDFWSKYGTLMQLGFMALMVVMLIVLFKQLDGVVTGLNNVASTLGEFKVISAGNSTQVFA